MSDIFYDPEAIMEKKGKSCDNYTNAFVCLPPRSDLHIYSPRVGAPDQLGTSLPYYELVKSIPTWSTSIAFKVHRPLIQAACCKLHGPHLISFFS